MKRSPGFAIAAVASLSIGIAATTAAFSGINAILFRSLPGVHESSRLAHIYTRAPWLGGPASRLEDYDRFRESLTAFAAIAAFAETSVAVQGSDEPFLARAVFVSDNYFEVLGTTAETGRLVDAAAGREPVVVVSHGFAVRRFGAVSGALSRTISVNGQHLQILGVTPPAFAGLKPGDVGDDTAARPTVVDAARDAGDDRAPGGAVVEPAQSTEHLGTARGRLAPGVPIEAAQQQAAGIVLHFPPAPRRPRW